MPYAFDGYSFDLFAFMRRRPSEKPQQRQDIEETEDLSFDDAEERRTRRINEALAFWGPAAFPVL